MGCGKVIRAGDDPRGKLREASVRIAMVWLGVAIALAVGGCSKREVLSSSELAEQPEAPIYQIGAGDTLSVFVWQNPALSTSVTVRPDGRITVPLIDDLPASGRTPTELSRDIEEKLAVYVQDPFVSVIVGGFRGTFAQQIRVVGAAAEPKSIPYRSNMTVLDVLIEVGGLTEFADGDNATIVRQVGSEQKSYRVRLDTLLKSGEISANAAVLPGDILIIPETFL